MLKLTTITQVYYIIKLMIFQLNFLILKSVNVFENDYINFESKISYICYLKSVIKEYNINSKSNKF